MSAGTPAFEQAGRQGGGLPWGRMFWAEGTVSAKAWKGGMSECFEEMQEARVARAEGRGEEWDMVSNRCVLRGRAIGGPDSSDTDL